MKPSNDDLTKPIEAQITEAAEAYGRFKNKFGQGGERFTAEDYARGIGFSVNPSSVKGFKAGAHLGVKLGERQALQRPEVTALRAAFGESLGKQNCVCKVNPFIGAPVPCELCSARAVMAAFDRFMSEIGGANE